MMTRAADNACDLGRIFDEMPCFVVHCHFDEHIAWKKPALGHRFLPALDFNHLFSGRQNLSKLILHAGPFATLPQCAQATLFLTGIHLHTIPALYTSGLRRGCFAHLTSSPKTAKKQPTRSSCRLTKDKWPSRAQSQTQPALSARLLGALAKQPYGLHARNPW